MLGGFEYINFLLLFIDIRDVYVLVKFKYLIIINSFYLQVGKDLNIWREKYVFKISMLNILNKICLYMWSAYICV